MSGIHRYPTLSSTHLAFVCEDTLQAVPRAGGMARRLSAEAGRVTRPRFAPDGQNIAFSSDLDGPMQVYRVDLDGGVPQRLTFEAGDCHVVGFDPDGQVVYRSQTGARLRSDWFLYRVPLSGGVPERLPFGRALTVSFGADGAVALGRNRDDSAHWKRYRGGTAGEVWAGTREEIRRLPLEGNPVLPTWAAGRLWYIADVDGWGNLWSCAPDGGDATQHTSHDDGYLRNLSACGGTLVYEKNGALFSYDAEAGEERALEVQTRPSGAQLRVRFPDPKKHLQDFDLAPDGKRLAATVRGKLLAMEAWGGPARPLGASSGVRYRLPVWLHDSQSIAVLSDESGEEVLELYSYDGELLEELALDEAARIRAIEASPCRRQVALRDIAGGLWLADFEGEDPSLTELARSTRGAIRQAVWAPDGRWLAYVSPLCWPMQGGILSLLELATGESTALSSAELPVWAPAFDPKGRFLYVLSQRTFNPILNEAQFGAAVTRSAQLFAYVLEKDGLSPFDQRWPEADKEREKAREKAKKQREKGDKDDDESKAEPEPLAIHLPGLADRLVVFPDLSPAEYSDLSASGNAVLFLARPRLGLLDQSFFEEERDEHLPKLVSFDLLDAKKVTMAPKVKGYQTRGAKTLLHTSAGLRLLKTGETPPKDPPRKGHNRFTGTIDLGRLRVPVVPGDEWKQMVRDAWRMQRAHFWTADMAEVDWEEVLERYLERVERVTTRAELSDLIWEMQGELGTSHAYEFGGDHPSRRSHPVGSLGADLAWDEAGGWRIVRLLRGDSWSSDAPPLLAPGVQVAEGERITAVDGEPCSAEVPLGALLVHKAHCAVELEIDGKRRVTVTTLGSERGLRYRQWINDNRQKVRDASDGQLGYLHIPNMSGIGLAEFFRSFRAESKLPGLIVDVRSNGGGFVSPLILDCLRRKVIGYDRPRYGKSSSYPMDAVRGPMVALCDQFAGSDGDMFSHSFKAYGLGPLIGKRTWGGVIGIDFNGALADGTVVTQPEYAFYFHDVGWSVENYGVDPDEEVENDPLSEAAGEDRQLDRAIAVALEQLAAAPVEEPTWPEVPSRRPGA